LLDSKDIGVEVNAKIIKCMFISHDWNAGQNHNFKITNKDFENLVKFRYLGMTLAYGRGNSGNAYYHSVQNLLFFWLSVKEYKD
jgi:hypothetical protein